MFQSVREYRITRRAAAQAIRQNFRVKIPRCVRAQRGKNLFGELSGFFGKDVVDGAVLPDHGERYLGQKLVKNFNETVHRGLGHAGVDMFGPDAARKTGRDNGSVFLKINRHLRAGVARRAAKIFEHVAAWRIARRGGLDAQHVKSEALPLGCRVAGADESVAVPLPGDAHQNG